MMCRKRWAGGVLLMWLTLTFSAAAAPEGPLGGTCCRSSSLVLTVRNDSSEDHSIG